MPFTHTRTHTHTHTHTHTYTHTNTHTHKHKYAHTGLQHVKNMSRYCLAGPLLTLSPKEMNPKHTLTHTHTYSGLPHVKNIGWYYLACPLLLDSVILILIGCIFTNLSEDRSYPLYW